MTATSTLNLYRVTTKVAEIGWTGPTTRAELTPAVTVDVLATTVNEPETGSLLFTTRFPDGAARAVMGWARGQWVCWQLIDRGVGTNRARQLVEGGALR